MKRALLRTTALVLSIGAVPSTAGTAEPVLAAFRVFNGTDEVSAETRVRIRVSGSEDEEGGLVLNGPALTAELAPGIYDAQAIHHRKGRVVSVRWAERLVIVRYPDEGSEHLEVINFVPGFGALQLRLPPGAKVDPSILTVRPVEDGDAARVRVHAGDDYLLVVAPAGTYALTLALPTGPATLPMVEIPGDRTRMRLVGDAGAP